MKIRFLFFASIREAAQRNEIGLDFPGTRVVEAISHLQNQFPDIADKINKAQVAVNEEYADRDTELKEGDTIALIPPVSGG